MKKTKLSFLLLFFAIASLLNSTSSFAQPYGEGKYDANVPYGGQTALSIATDGNVSIPINSPTSTGVLATGTSTVTVTSQDVVGYKLYIRTLGSANMVNGSANLPASANGTPAQLATDTWGYNTDASTNFMGPATTDTLVKSFTGPIKTGDATTFTYGVKIDLAKPAGQYSATVLYTAAPQTN